MINKKIISLTLIIIILTAMTGCSMMKSANHFRNATKLERNGDFAAAIKEYKLSLKEDPMDITAKEGMAAAYEKMGKFEQAINYWEKIMSDRFADPSKVKKRIKKLKEIVILDKKAKNFEKSESYQLAAEQYRLIALKDKEYYAFTLKSAEMYVKANNKSRAKSIYKNFLGKNEWRGFDNKLIEKAEKSLSKL